MSERFNLELVSRRRAFSFLGSAAAFVLQRRQRCSSQRMPRPALVIQPQP